MKIKVLFVLIFFYLMGSQLVSSQSTAVNLPIIDISKNHPKKEIIIQEIADIEYVALETTDDILLSERAVLSYISDKYILVYEPVLGDIFVFNRNGKICSQFNHKGQSGKEYSWIRAGVIFDEKNEEIYVCSQSIQVYKINGEFKRTLKKNAIQNELKVYNFDNETLLIYEGVNIDPAYEVFAKKNGLNFSPTAKPYSLISKKDGSTVFAFDIFLPIRYSNKFAQVLENNTWRPIEIFFPNSIYYGEDFMIADISCDTMFLLTKEKILTPILVRKPSVHTSEPRRVWTTLLTTDRFIVMGIIPLDINSKSGKIPFFLYEFKTGEFSILSIFDSEYGMKEWGPSTSPVIAKNMTAELRQTHILLEAYKKKQLKGKFEKFVETLDEDDNPIVRIMTFK